MGTQNDPLAKKMTSIKVSCNSGKHVTYRASIKSGSNDLN